MKRSSGRLRTLAAQFITPSTTLAVVVALYCGYAGSTSTRVTPWVLSSSITEAMEGLP
ncbi:hypothetical protein D9M69_700790 [compost metagenome]